MKISTEPFSIKKAVEPYSPSRQMTSPLRKSRRLIARMFQIRKGRETPPNASRISGFSCWIKRSTSTVPPPGSSVSTTLRCIKAPVGQSSEHSPQATQDDPPMGESRSKAIRA